MYDLIEKKKQGGSPLMEEIAHTVRGFVAGDIPDYQMPAMLVVIYFKGMDDREITGLTLEVVHSRDMVNLSPIKGIKADKHSTGGVGNKTTLMTGPVVATCSVEVAKMNGRGLGHTGGAVDKLESTPGFKIAISGEGFFHIVDENGLILISQSGDMVPVDKKLYALRDVTATVDSIPPVVPSIMSKELAAGSDCTVLDVKTGGGAFVKTLRDSISLARKMVSIGVLAGRCCCALITNVDIPLGHTIGNSLEMEEATRTLKDRRPEDLTCVCLELAVNMLHMIGRGDMEQCGKIAQGVMGDRNALKCLKSMIESQGEDGRYTGNPELFHKVPLSREVKIFETGFIIHMDTEGIGVASVMLGAGRNKKEDAIDYSMGILLGRKYRDSVREGETIAVLRASREELFRPAMGKSLAPCTLGKQMPGPEPPIPTRISDAGVGRRAIEEKTL